jgi:peptidoglycan/xylan/chitin deacetylase (PgdA/CDA1 family)
MRSPARGVAKELVTLSQTAAWRLRGRPGQPGLRILCWHRVARVRDQLAVAPERFARQLELIERSELPVVDLAAAVASEREGRALALTFDDGYRDLLDHAIPLLERRGWPATVFVVTEAARGRASFPWYGRGDQPPFLGWDEMRDLERRTTIRCEPHTLTHADLPGLPDADAEREIHESRAVLGHELGRPGRLLCYPGGFAGARERALAEAAGYLAAVTCEPGCNVPPFDRYGLRRLMVDRYDPSTVFAAKLAGAGDRALPARGVRA